jgi:fibronectin-binding autotransporter adhesin
MKPKFRTNQLLAGSIALFVTFSTLHADDGTWIATAAGPFNWSDTANWADTNEDTIGDVADGTGFTAFFTPNITANQVVTVDTARTIGNITFTDSTTSSHNLTIGPADPLQTLTLDVSTGLSLIDVTQSGRTLIISAPLTVSDGIQQTGPGALTISGATTISGGIQKDSGTGALTFSGPITLGGAQTWTNNSTTTLLTGNGTNLITNGGNQLTVAGTGTTTFGVITSANETLTGSGALVKNGTGRLNIGGNNSNFTGTVTINGGIMHVHNVNEPMGTGNLTLNGGVMSWYWGATYTRTLGTGTSQVQIPGGESGFAGSGTTGPTINLGSSVRWGTAGEGAVDEDTGATGFFNPSKFVLGDAGTGNAATTTFSSGIDLNGATRTIVVPKGTSAGGNRSTISGAISNSTGTAGLVKEGDGWLFLSNNTSAWNGSTTLSGGFLDMGGINLANIGGGSGRNITVANGAVIRFNALSNAILNRIVETTDEIGVMTGTTANNFDFSSSTGANLPNAFLGNWAGNGAKMTYSGILTPASDNYRLGAKGSSGLLGITTVMSGTQGLIVGQTGATGTRNNIVAANTFTGETVINSGNKLTLGNNLALQNSALNVGAAGGNFALAAGTNGGRITGETAAPSPTFGGLIGSRNLISVFTNSAGNNETNLAASAVTGFTLNPGTGVTVTYSGAIGGFGVGPTGSTGGNSTLTKTGEGTQILTGTHTYTGATTVTGGTLDLGTTGSIAASTALVLGPAGTLDTSDQTANYAIPASQPVTFGIDSTGSGSSGKIVADELDISSATVTYDIPVALDDPVYVLATYTAGNLTGTFLSVPAAPSGYELDYDYEGNKIALVSTGAPTGFAAWQSANSTAGTFADDHDNDGVDNGTEFFLGGTTDTTGFTALPGVTNTGGTLSVTWTKAATYGGTYGSDFVVETSATLANPWTTETLGVNVTVVGDDVTYTFPAGTRNFARLKVTGP